MPDRFGCRAWIASARCAWILISSCTLVACSGERPLPGEQGASDAGLDPAQASHDAGKIKQPVDVCPPANPYCQKEPAKPAPTCGNQPIDLDPVGVNVMIAIDGSASMGTHWTRIQDAIENLRANYPDSSFGLHLFWGELADSYESGVAKANWCGATQNRVLEVGEHDGSALREFLGAMPPGPSYLGGLFETSPVIEPLNYYLTHASKLADPTRTNYLVFVSDGNDNCFGSLYTNKADKVLAYEKLAVELGKLHIRVLPIGFDAASVPGGGSGLYGSTPADTNLEVLATLLEHGGSGLSEVPKVDDPDKLGEVIAQVGQTVRNCRFAIPAALDPAQAVNPFELNFAVGGSVIARDRMRHEGWNFVAGNTTQVELFGKACEAVRAKAPLEARKTCANDVCGTAAIEVQTKSRAVLYVLDASASRIQCVDGTFGCFMYPDSPGRVGLTYWETVQHALGQSLVAPINDDIEFGIQFFPGKTAAQFSCELASEPAVAPAQGTEIGIMSQMLEKLPFGFTPLVQVLENVASAPGRLADPSVQGAVVLLTDGGDNCSGASQEQMVERLGNAARTLHDANVKSYVIRFGTPDGKTAEQEAQLRAIVENGGTALVDPADPTRSPYIDAVDESALDAALAELSDTLATCSFALGGLSDDADKDNVNLYLNGEVVPFDSQHTKQEGWGWQDAEQTSIELFGAWCSEFKTNRKTSLSVEFGCAPVIVI